MYTKLCSKCKTDKDIQAFYAHPNSADGLSYWCKICQKKSSSSAVKRNRQKYANLQRKWRKDNANRASELSQKHKKILKEKRAEIRARRKLTRDVLWDMFSKSTCTDCGESDPIVLEFDHVKGEKLFNISSNTKGYWNEKIQTEISKCEIVCANCHRRRTSSRANHWRFTRTNQ